MINVEHIAEQRSIEINQVNETNPPSGMVGDVIGIRVDGQGGETHRILGTVYADGLPASCGVDDFNMDMVPEGNMVVIVNKDQPGVIGFVGSTFGDASVNIADMVISRVVHADKTATALMMIKTDTAPTKELFEKLRAKPNILKVRRGDYRRGMREDESPQINADA